jgi:hypothetical protein
MSTDTAGIGFPDDAQTFHCSRGTKGNSWFSFIVFAILTATGVFLLVWSLFFFKKGEDGMGYLALAVGALGIPFFAGCAFPYWRDVMRAKGVVAVNDEGIWYASPRAPSLFLPWRDVVQVTAHDVGMDRRLELADGAGRKINVPYGIQGLSTLRDFIMEHTVRQPGPSTPGVFHCIGETAILAICIGIFVVFAIMAFRSDSVEHTLYFLGFAALGIVGLLARKTKVIVGSDSIQICYPLWKRTSWVCASLM